MTVDSGIFGIGSEYTWRSVTKWSNFARFGNVMLREANRVLTKTHPVPATSRVRQQVYSPEVYPVLFRILTNSGPYDGKTAFNASIQNGSQLAIALTRQNFFFLFKLGVIKTQNVFPYTAE